MADINFKPIVGHIYQLFERKNGKETLSMAGQNEWKKSIAFTKFVATTTLLSDHT